ncbi:MAG: hypothetical protein ABIQ44_14075 [Chloroflexia bacterium]
MTQSVDAPQPMLTFTWTMSYPYEINESLGVYSDGSVWYWSLRPAEVRLHNRVGTFNFQLPDREFEDLLGLAAELAGTQTDNGQPARSTMAVNVIANAEGKTQTHLLSASSTDGDNATFASTALERAYNIGQDLMRRAEDAPLAVVKLDWKPASTGVKVGQAANVNFIFENIGIEPVLLKVGLDEYALYEAQPNNVSAKIWQGAELTGTGIQGDDEGMGGPPRDGTYVAATIKPGTKSTAFFQDALLFQQPGTMHVGAAVLGKINIYYPTATKPQTAATADWPFSLETQPRQISAK